MAQELSPEAGIIMSYVSTWNWQLLAILFLISSFIMFALPRTTITSAFYVGLFLVFIVCEFFTLKRKRELEKGQNE